MVFQKNVASWCMAPIKWKRKDSKDHFRNSKLAEPLIQSDVNKFVTRHIGNSWGFKVEEHFGTGLVRSAKDEISAVSPGRISIVNLEGDSKVLNFIRDGHMPNCVKIDEEKWVFMIGHEYKHKSFVVTVQKCRNIVCSVLRSHF